MRRAGFDASALKAEALSYIAQDSFSVSEICLKVGIGRKTFYEWLKNDAEFAESVKVARGEFKEKITIEAKYSLRKLVQGFEYVEKKVIQVPSGEKDENGEDKPRIKEQHSFRKFVPPNTAAVIFALTNGDPEHWQQRGAYDINAKVQGEHTSTINLPDDVLFEIADRIQDYEYKSRTDNKGSSEETAD